METQIYLEWTDRLIGLHNDVSKYQMHKTVYFKSYEFSVFGLETNGGKKIEFRPIEGYTLQMSLLLECSLIGLIDWTQRLLHSLSKI